jgi:hypothetical protein
VDLPLLILVALPAVFALADFFISPDAADKIPRFNHKVSMEIFWAGFLSCPIKKNASLEGDSR